MSRATDRVLTADSPGSRVAMRARERRRIRRLSGEPARNMPNNHGQSNQVTITAAGFTLRISIDFRVDKQDLSRHRIRGVIAADASSSYPYSLSFDEVGSPLVLGADIRKMVRPMGEHLAPADRKAARSISTTLHALFASEIGDYLARLGIVDDIVSRAFSWDDIGEGPMDKSSRWPVYWNHQPWEDQ
jgi:hypothetical protein